MKIMKRLMAMLVAVMVVMPLAHVNAAEAPYAKGELVIFIKNETQDKMWDNGNGSLDVGQWVRTTGKTYPGDEQYIEAFVSGFVGNKTPFLIPGGPPTPSWAEIKAKTIVDTEPYKHLLEQLNEDTSNATGFDVSGKYVKPWTEYNNARIVEIDELNEFSHHLETDLQALKFDFMRKGYYISDYDTLLNVLLRVANQEEEKYAIKYFSKEDFHGDVELLGEKEGRAAIANISPVFGFIAIPKA